MEYLIKISLGPSRGVAMSEPTMGDVERSHKVFVMVENCQVEHQGTIVKAIGMFQCNFFIVLMDLGTSIYLISSSLI